MEPVVIKNEKAYSLALTEIEKLMDLDPEPGSAEGKRLELLVHLVDEYERRNVARPGTTPIDAIVFRMEQSNLRQTDLVPYIGSRSKVSEILSGKRDLTLSMIRALHNGLGIPAKSLIELQPPFTTIDESEDWSKYPVREMCARNWIQCSYAEAKKGLSEVFEEFFAPVGGVQSVAAFYRKSSAHIRTGRQMNKFALLAWTAKVMRDCIENPPTASWKKGTMTMDKMRAFAKLSVLPDGPLRAQQKLREEGICLVIEQQLPRTYLDGAAILKNKKHPVIGLSLRYDRIDNFWFTLFHELAHLSLHYDDDVESFVDDLDVRKDDDPKEIEADQLACEALIPDARWAGSAARVFPNKDAILRFAREIDVHPAVVAGRIRNERNSYHLYNELVGHGRIKYLFGLTTEE